MFRNYLHLPKTIKIQPFKWNDSSRMLEAAKINSPLHFNNLVEKRVYKQKSEPPEVPSSRVRIFNELK
ncbi:unnamed protein product [Blepharisma stoltei]|uniref:Uncharacterized protein n=1 Tax=Blepharisma stoltei TaxID=1481888 RepID=A0AAU9K032_9CILI|nr:unnamed protein product [Blepharisma stoltei]